MFVFGHPTKHFYLPHIEMKVIIKSITYLLCRQKFLLTKNACQLTITYAYMHLFAYLGLKYHNAQKCINIIIRSAERQSEHTSINSKKRFKTISDNTDRVIFCECNQKQYYI